MSGHRDGVTRIGIGIGAALATILAGAATAGDGVDCPPNPRPGACYESPTAHREAETAKAHRG